MSKRVLLGIIAGVTALAMVPASAADFSPKTKFTLSSRKAKANPALTIFLQQDGGEDELGEVTLKIPKGFKIASDAAIPADTQIGAGEIKITAGPGCAGGIGTNLTTVPVTIEERNRTGAEQVSGVKAVWFVDLEPVTRVRLQIKGSVTKGWSATGSIPANALTCPPFSFLATIQAKAAGVKVITNPTRRGNYVFQALYKSNPPGSTASTRQTIRIK